MIEWKMQSNGRRQMNNITAYIILLIAVILGTASNSFAKSAQGFTLLIPSIITAVTIVGCMYTLSLVMKSIPVGITYASFAGLCICLLYTSPSPRDYAASRMPSSA